MNKRWGELPFAALTTSLTLGIGVSLLLHQYSFDFLVIGALALLAAAFLALRRERVIFSLCCGLASVALAGLLLVLARRDSFPVSDVRSLLARHEFPLGEIVQFDGCVADDTRSFASDTILTVQLRGCRYNGQWRPCRGLVLARMPETPPDDGSPTPFAVGDRVRGAATWNRPHRYRNPGSYDRTSALLRRGVILVGRVKSSRVLERIPGECSNPLTDVRSKIRARLRLSTSQLATLGLARESAILASIVFGDYSQLDTETREAFQNSGTYHVLVVSGLHVGWIAWLLSYLLRRLSVPERASRWFIAAGILIYSGIVGFQASISRALWMFLLYTAGRALFRRATAANIVLASAFLLLVVRPDWLFDAGFQLSFLSILAICLMALPIIERSVTPLLEPLKHTGNPERLQLEPGFWHRCGRHLRIRCELLAESGSDRWSSRFGSAITLLCRWSGAAAAALAGIIIVSLAVQVWLEPLLAYHFNRLTWIAPVANLIIVPLSSAVLAVGLLAALNASLPGSTLTLKAASWLASLLLNAARAMSEMPGAWQRCPTPALAWVLAAVLFVAAWCLLAGRRFWVAAGLTGIFLICLGVPAVPLRTLFAPWRISDQAMEAKRTLHLTFLDVGQGDSIVIRFPNSRVWLVDSGGIRETPGQDHAGSFDIGEAVVSRYLWFLWTSSLDRIILTHPHQDHAGGMAALMKNFPVSRFDFAETTKDPLLDQVLNTASARHIPAHLIQAGAQYVLGDVRINVLHPSGDHPERSPNEKSIVLKLAYGRFSALLAGDVEKAGEADLMARPDDLRSMLLKVAHHGSRYATLDPLLTRVQPRWGIISAGSNNPFGHPARELLLRLLRHGVRPMTTIDNGAIFFDTDGVQYRLESHVAGLLESGTLPDIP